MTDLKSTNNKTLYFSAQIFYQGGSFTEIFQNQKLEVKIWHFLKPCHHSIFKDTAVSFEHVHTFAKTLLIFYPRTWISITGFAIIRVMSAFETQSVTYCDENCQFKFFCKNKVPEWFKTKYHFGIESREQLIRIWKVPNHELKC